MAEVSISDTTIADIDVLLIDLNINVLTVVHSCLWEASSLSLWPDPNIILYYIGTIYY